MKIAIAGAGAAGCCAAVLLHNSGYSVTVFEKVPDPAPVGAGILLQNNGLQALKAAGLYEQILAAGARVDRFLSELPEGREVLRLEYKDLGSDFFGIGIHRGSFLSLLLSEVKKLHINTLTGKDIVSYRERGTALFVSDASGEEFGPFDLLIISDGTRSKLAGTILSRQTYEYQWAALWTYVPEPFLDHSASLYQVYRGTGNVIGLLPTGTLYGKGTSIFWGIHKKDIDGWMQSPLDIWKDRVLGLAPLAEPLLQHLYSHSQFAFATYRDIRSSSFSNRKNIVVIGDAAHSMSPHLGQGANFALSDALILSEALKEIPDLPVAFKIFERERMTQVKLYQMLSHLLFPFFQSGREFLAPVRNTLFPALSRVPFLRKAMLQVFTGIRKGWMG